MSQELNWAAVRARYEQQKVLPALTGDTTLEVVDIDDEKMCLRQRLWQDCLTRGNLETAFALLGDQRITGSAVEFAEGLRRYYSGGPQVQTGCSRIPNMSAVVLKDLGYLPS